MESPTNTSWLKWPLTVKTEHSTTVQFNFYAGLLTNGKMSIEIYEGFTFNNFLDADYARANVTDSHPLSAPERF